MSRLSDTQIKCLSEAIMEVGGPYWHRVLEMHGPAGSRSEQLAGFAPHHLWLATAQQYCEYADAQKPIPPWLQLGSKAMHGEGGELREKEVIEASHDAYGWTREEDDFVISQLAELRAPDWPRIHESFVKRFGSANGTTNANAAARSSRSAADIERRAVVLHRYHTYFAPLAVPAGLRFCRTEETNSFGFPRNPGWTELEDAKLLEGLEKVKGSHWNKILGLYGASGSVGSELAGKSEIDLAKRARELWVHAASGGGARGSLSAVAQRVVPFITAKGYNESGLPTSRGWNDELDRLLLSELNILQAPNYNDILKRHGTGGRISERLAPKTYAQLRLRALKLYDHCISEGKPLPPGLQYAKRKRAREE